MRRVVGGALPRFPTEERIKCPFLDTVNRAVLDFDLYKQCSVTLLRENVYMCLVCGQFFQGRGKTTPAYTHSVQNGHHVFINLRTERFYCLPGALAGGVAGAPDAQSDRGARRVRAWSARRELRGGGQVPGRHPAGDEPAVRRAGDSAAGFELHPVAGYARHRVSARCGAGRPGCVRAGGLTLLRPVGSQATWGSTTSRRRTT